MNNDDTGHVFVYGSLKRGQVLYFHEPLMDLRVKVEQGRVRAALLYDLGPFPGIVLQPEGGIVSGEVHSFREPEKAIKILDEIEAYHGEGDPHNLYRRVRCQAELTDGRMIPCWLYEYVGPLDGAHLIENGVWPGVGVKR